MSAASVPDLGSTFAYDYELPAGLVAHDPAPERDAARLLDCSREPPEERRFTAFPELLNAGDVLVINDTRVVPARLRGRRVPGGGAAEVLLLRPADGGPFDLATTDWQALARPGRRLQPGARIAFGPAGEAHVVRAAPDGTRIVRFAPGALAAIAAAAGEVPLPPYVRAAAPGDPRAARYQTVFARAPGSVAAPTASLHFTDRVLESVRARGVRIAPLTLDVGLGTFRPVAAPRVDEHAMHAERYTIPEETAAAVRAARTAGRRVVAAGTTVVRALEGSAQAGGVVRSGPGETALFIRPGFRFAVVDALLTNFHLPRSTLLMLVCALGGYERVFAAYRYAIAHRFRFYSFGDAMFVLNPRAPGADTVQEEA